MRVFPQWWSIYSKKARYWPQRGSCVVRSARFMGTYSSTVHVQRVCARTRGSLARMRRQIFVRASQLFTRARLCDTSSVVVHSALACASKFFTIFVNKFCHTYRYTQFLYYYKVLKTDVTLTSIIFCLAKSHWKTSLPIPCAFANKSALLLKCKTLFCFLLVFFNNRKRQSNESYICARMSLSNMTFRRCVRKASVISFRNVRSKRYWPRRRSCPIGRLSGLKGQSFCELSNLYVYRHRTLDPESRG